MPIWCRGRDLNPHRRMPTAPSRPRVYQFHHLGLAVRWILYHVSRLGAASRARSVGCLRWWLPVKCRALGGTGHLVRQSARLTDRPRSGHRGFACQGGKLDYPMAFSRPHRDKQVRLTVFDNEPLARLAEQRLRQAGIPCLIRCLRGGPGLWGSAYNLPHDLYVYASDETPAREVLDLTSEGLEQGESQDSPRRSNPNLRFVMAGIILAVLAVVIVVSAFSRLG